MMRIKPEHFSQFYLLSILWLIFLVAVTISKINKFLDEKLSKMDIFRLFFCRHLAEKGAMTIYQRELVPKCKRLHEVIEKSHG